MQKNYDFNVPVLALSGQQIEGTTKGRELAGLLAAQTKGNAVKIYTWAQTLYSGSPLVLDASDVQTLTKIIDDAEGATVLLKAQLLEVLA